MKLLSWNIDRTNRRDEEKCQAILELNPELVVLLEFQIGVHKELLELLKEIYPFYEYYDPSPKKNGIVICSKQKIERGPISGPSYSPGTIGQIYLPELDIDLIGTRFIYPKNDKRFHFDVQMEHLKSVGFEKLEDRSAIVIGDFNISRTRSFSGKGHSKAQDILNEISEDSWSFVEPENSEPTYLARSGKTSSHIDHCMVTSRFSSRYDINLKHVLKTENYEIAGTKNSLSDHAMLLLEFSSAIGSLPDQ